MQVSLENLGTLERRLTVRIPADRYETRVRERIRELGQTVRLKGFRPGKVPAKVIEQRFGAQVRNEAMSDVVGSSFQEAVKQENLRPAVAPSIKTNRDPGAGDIEYVATFEVVPEIGAVDVAALEITRPVARVEERDIDVMIETLRAQRKQWSPVDRGAAVGDMALFEYSAQTADGRHPETGLDRVGTIVGSGALSPALEEKLVGLKADDRASFEISFPANFRQPALAGKTGQVELHVIRVQEGKLPEVDEAFVHAFGIREGGIEKFRQDVRANLERELHNALRARTKTEVVEKLVRANASLEVPKGMVGVESQAMLREGQVRAERMGFEAPTSAESFTSGATQRVRAFLLINEIARQNSITIDQRRVADELASIASTYEEPEKVVEMYSRDAELMNSLKSRVIEDQVVEWIVEHARVTNQDLSFDQVMKPA